MWKTSGCRCGDQLLLALKLDAAVIVLSQLYLLCEEYTSTRSQWEYPEVVGRGMQVFGVICVSHLYGLSVQLLSPSGMPT